MRMAVFIVVAALASLGAVQATGQAVANRVIGPSVPPESLGLLGEDCKEKAVEAKCSFTPQEARNYYVDVFSQACLGGAVVVKQAGQALPSTRADRTLFSDRCRIAKAKTRLKAGEKVEFKASVAAGSGSPRIWIEIRKG